MTLILTPIVPLWPADALTQAQVTALLGLAPFTPIPAASDNSYPAFTLQQGQAALNTYLLTHVNGSGGVVVYSETLNTSKPEGSSVSFSSAYGAQINFDTITTASGSPFNTVFSYNGQNSFATLPAEYLNKPFIFIDGANVRHTKNSAGVDLKFVDGTITL